MEWAGTGAGEKLSSEWEIEQNKSKTTNINGNGNKRPRKLINKSNKRDGSAYPDMVKLQHNTKKKQAKREEGSKSRQRQGRK